MKIFPIEFDLTRPSNRQISTATNSSIAYGIKVFKDKEVQTGCTIKAYINGTEIDSEADLVDGFTIFKRTTPNDPTSFVVDIVYSKDGITQPFKLIHVTKEKNAFYAGGGSGGEYVLPTASATVKGGIKVGANLSIDANGVLSAAGGGSGGAARWGEITGSLTDQRDLKEQLETMTESITGSCNDYAEGKAISAIGVAEDYTDEEIGKIEIPTKTSDLTNDSGFIDRNTAAEIAGTAAGGALTDAQEYTDSQIAQLDIPTKTSDLTNDSGFITESDIPAIPTKTSDLTNDSGFITSVPQASDSTIGGVKINGNNLEILADGTLSAASGGGSSAESDPVFTQWKNGGYYQNIEVGPGTVIASGSNNFANVVIGNEAGQSATNFYMVGGVAIGNRAKITNDNIAGANSGAVAIGSTAKAGSEGIALSGKATGHRSICIGGVGEATGRGAICIGGQYSSSAPNQNSVQIGCKCDLSQNYVAPAANIFQVYAFPMLDGMTGLIPLERLGTGYDATKTQVLKHVNGVATWVEE